MVELIVPWRSGCPHRQRALELVLDRLAGWKVTVAEGPDGPWVKALAAMPAVRESDAQIVVVHDADCWTAELPGAVRAVEDGAAWAIPHAVQRRLTQDSTGRVLAGGSPDGLPLTERQRVGRRGGIFVLPRQTLLSVPLDPRFVGWGHEDECHALALDRLAGSCWQGSGVLWHLWHPPQPRRSRERGCDESWRLRRRYHAARHDKNLMAAIIEEAKRELDRVDQQAVCDRPPVGV